MTALGRDTTGGNGQHFPWGFFSLVPFNPNPPKPLADQSRITDPKKDTVTGLNPVKGVERNNINL